MWLEWKPGKDAKGTKGQELRAEGLTAGEQSDRCAGLSRLEQSKVEQGGWTGTPAKPSTTVMLHPEVVCCNMTSQSPSIDLGD